MKLTADQKGTIAETAIVHAAAKLGVDVYRPIGEGGRYDMILDIGSHLLRIQCKWAPRHGDVVILRCYSSRRNCHGVLRRPYRDGEFDAYGAYCPDLDACFLIPYAAVAGRLEVALRLRPAANNQRTGINWADDFEFAVTLERLGAIAQLGERDAGSVEVAGSSPAGSTSELRNYPELSS